VIGTGQFILLMYYSGICLENDEEP